MSTREGISPEYAEVQSPVAPCTAGTTAPHRSSAPRMLRQIADADGASQDALRVDDGQAAGKCNKSLVGMFDAKQRAARLRQIADLPSRHAEEDLSLIHISEPTRLGMISYAVFCLKK